MSVWVSVSALPVAAGTARLNAFVTECFSMVLMCLLWRCRAVPSRGVALLESDVIVSAAVRTAGHLSPVPSISSGFWRGCYVVALVRIKRACVRVCVCPAAAPASVEVWA
jgi:hypothetical protein